ncbi:hypothetical protein Tco_1317888 [Tanacetum coccineum]
MNRLKLNKITRADLVGLVFKLLKGTCKSCLKLEYTIEECYRALTDQPDWTSPEACSTERQYSSSIMKTPAARRVDQKLNKFKEGNFLDLHLNDIEDMLLLIAQNNLFNLDGDVIVDFVTALKMFTQSTIIQNKIKDVQLGVETVQEKDSEKLRSAGWWKENRDGQKTIAKDSMTSQNQRDLPRDIPIDSIEVHSDDGNPTSANIKKALRQVHVKMEMEIPRSSRVKLITACSYSIEEWTKKAEFVQVSIDNNQIVASEILFKEGRHDFNLEAAIIDDDDPVLCPNILSCPST